MEAKMNKARRLMRAALILGAVATAVVASAACAEEATKTGNGPTLSPAANDPSAQMPVDATPSPDGKDIYFIASSTVPDENGIGTVRQPAIYHVSAAGGAINKLFQGDPLVAPFNIAISNDGKTLYIADVGAVTSEDRSDGRVFSMGVGGGAPSPLAGTEGLAPGGLEVMGDSLFVTGKKDGKSGLYKTGFAGGNVNAVAAGAPFSDPSGVTIARDGTAYVVDTGSATSGNALASVVKVTADGKTEVIMDGLSVGYPAGIALSNDDKTLYVSGFDPGKGTDVVFTVDTASHVVGEFTDTISEFTTSAGLHRAKNSDTFAWADSHANGSGTVYVLRTSGQ